MKLRFVFALMVGIFFGVATVHSVRAADAPPAGGGERVDEFEQKEEGDDSANQAAEEPETEAEPEQKPSSKGRSRAKEAEGSKAPNRFEADVVTKSSYKLGGESLEVDPD